MRDHWSALSLFMFRLQAFCFIKFLANISCQGSSRGRVVKALDLKSNGDSRRRFEPCQLRIILDSRNVVLVNKGPHMRYRAK